MNYSFGRLRIFENYKFKRAARVEELVRVHAAAWGMPVIFWSGAPRVVARDGEDRKRCRELQRRLRRALWGFGGSVYMSARGGVPAVTLRPRKRGRSRVWRFARAMWRWKRSGFAVVPKRVLVERRRICGGCAFWDEVRGCRSCGCRPVKLRMASEKCPRGKWGKAEVGGRRSDRIRN